jgi:hypothetical protein
MSYNKLVNGVSVPMTQEEITARQAEEAAWAVSKLAAVLPAYYFEKLNGGITVNGVFIATGPEDRNLIGGAVTRAVVQNNDALTHPYYPTGGGSVSLTNAQYKALGLAIAEHVQKCLDAEDTVQANIGNYTTEQQIKDAFDAAYAA